MTRLALLASLVASSVAFADNAPTGPDFVHASSSSKRSIDPQDTVEFPLDKAELTAAGIDQVDAAARWLARNPKHQLVLEGHTDASGVAAYNDDLAMRRMCAVREQLIARGIKSDRIVLLNFGEREAKAVENPLHGADRRVVLYATKLSPEAVVGMTRDRRPATAAVWTHDGTLVRIDEGLTRLSTMMVARR